MSQNPTSLSLFTLTIRGTLAAPTLEAARQIHNQTAGAPANIAAARALGDLSHMVYTPLQANGSSTGEFLVMDIWNSLEGLGQFFADPHVQEGGGMIFASRDPVVWAPAAGFTSYHLPAPFGQNERIVAIVRGTLTSLAQAQAIHNSAAAGGLPMARRAGNLSHEAFLRMAPPGAPEALEFMGVDVWSSHDGMHAVYDSPEFLHSMDGLFSAEPDFSVWRHPAGEWAEW